MFYDLATCTGYTPYGKNYIGLSNIGTHTYLSSMEEGTCTSCFVSATAAHDKCRCPVFVIPYLFMNARGHKVRERSTQGAHTTVKIYAPLTISSARV